MTEKPRSEKSPTTRKDGEPTPFERLQAFTERLVKVPKEEIEKVKEDPPRGLR